MCNSVRTPEVTPVYHRGLQPYPRDRGSLVASILHTRVVLLTFRVDEVGVRGQPPREQARRKSGKQDMSARDLREIGKPVAKGRGK